MAELGGKENDSIIAKYGEERVNTNGPPLSELCHSYHLKTINGFYTHRDIHKCTWVKHTREL